jgi:hypothetical protein
MMHGLIKWNASNPAWVILPPAKQIFPKSCPILPGYYMPDYPFPKSSYSSLVDIINPGQLNTYNINVSIHKGKEEKKTYIGRVRLACPRQGEPTRYLYRRILSPLRLPNSATIPYIALMYLFQLFIPYMGVFLSSFLLNNPLCFIIRILFIIST